MKFWYPASWEGLGIFTVNIPWKLYAKWNKPDTKGQISYDSTYEVQRRVRFIETKYNNSGGEIGNYWLMGIVRVWDNENVLEMDNGDGYATL